MYRLKYESIIALILPFLEVVRNSVTEAWCRPSFRTQILKTSCVFVAARLATSLKIALRFLKPGVLAKHSFAVSFINLDKISLFLRLMSLSKSSVSSEILIDMVMLIVDLCFVFVFVSFLFRFYCFFPFSFFLSVRRSSFKVVRRSILSLCGQ